MGTGPNSGATSTPEAAQDPADLTAATPADGRAEANPTTPPAAPESSREATAPRAEAPQEAAPAPEPTTAADTPAPEVSEASTPAPAAPAEAPAGTTEPATATDPTATDPTATEPTAQPASATERAPEPPVATTSAVEATPASDPAPTPDPEPEPEPEPKPDPEPGLAVGTAPETDPNPESGPEPDAAPAAPPEPPPASAPVATQAPVPTQAPAPDPSDDARRRFLRALRPRASRGQAVAALVAAVLGFSFIEARQNQPRDVSSLRQSDLLSVLDNVTQQSARLDDEVRGLQQTRDMLRSGTDRSAAAQRAAQQRLDVLGVLTGTRPARGPGIQLVISDPKAGVLASTLLETLQELRDAGAEAVQIGDVRVVASTSFVDDPGGVRVDGRLLTPPYRMLVIGNPQTLSTALGIPGGVLEVLRGKGAAGEVIQEQSLDVTALRQVTSPQYARPAPGGS